MLSEGRSVPDSEEASHDEADELLRRLALTPTGVSDAAVVVERRRTFVAGAVIATRYRLERQLGEGGMGTVWAATHTITGNRVALKFLKASHGKESDARRRFLREARAAGAIHHPNVVDVLDAFELDDGAPVIVMDLLEGETLGQRLSRERRLDLMTTVGLLLPVAQAIAAAHRAGIVHRDLKPDNIFLVQGVRGAVDVKVLDFGVAKLLRSAATESDAATSTGTLIGTPAYMPLEQAVGQADLDQRVDVWALGAVLYECLAGERAVKGSNVAQAVLQITGCGIRSLSAVVPELPADIADCVDRMLARERDARPSDLSEVIALLTRHSRSGSAPGDHSGPWARRVRGARLMRRALTGAAVSMLLMSFVEWRFVEQRPGRSPSSSPAHRATSTATARAVVTAASLAPPEPSANAGAAASAAPTRNASVARSPAAGVRAPNRAPMSAESAGTTSNRAPFDGGLVDKVPF